MSRSVVSVGHGATVGAAWRLMLARRVRHLPVVDADRRLVGMLTERDLQQVVLERCLEEAKPGALDRLRVDEVMSWGVIAVPPETDLRRAAEIMRERRVGALPVAEGGRLVGILTATDIIRALLGGAGAR